MVQFVKITCETSDADIRYTLDGSDPSENSNSYLTQFEINPPITIKAKAYKTGYIESGIVVFNAEQKEKLATPVLAVRGNSFNKELYISNTSSYPSTAIAHVLYDSYISGVEGDTFGIDEILAFYEPDRTLYVWVSCEGYEDSDYNSYYWGM